MMWDLVYVHSSFWASITTAFQGIHLNIIQLDWISTCTSKRSYLLCILGSITFPLFWLGFVFREGFLVQLLYLHFK